MNTSKFDVLFLSKTKVFYYSRVSRVVKFFFMVIRWSTNSLLVDLKLSISSWKFPSSNVLDTSADSSRWDLSYYSKCLNKSYGNLCMIDLFSSIKSIIWRFSFVNDFYLMIKGTVWFMDSNLILAFNILI